MNPQATDLLSQLRDIHSAPAVPWWPPAPGWWILAGLLLALIGYGLYRAWGAWQRRLRRRRILGWVDEVERSIDPKAAPQEFLAAVNRIFKLVALSAFPDRSCARLQGEEWTGFLRQELGGSRDAEQLAALAAGPYQPVPEFDAAAMGRLARQWIRRHG